jgi:hypothetical protein
VGWSLAGNYLQGLLLGASMTIGVILSVLLIVFGIGIGDILWFIIIWKIFKEILNFIHG